MSPNDYIQCFIYMAVLLLLAKPLGIYMARVMEGESRVNTLVVPVPVRSALTTPFVLTGRIKSSYWERMACVMAVIMFAGLFPGS